MIDSLTLDAGLATAIFDVGGTDIKHGVRTADGSLVDITSEPTPLGDDRATAIIDRIAELTALARQRHPDIAAVGAVAPGIVDDGIGIFSENLDWHDVPFRERIAAATGLPTAFGHDVASAALAESRLGAAVGASTVFVMVIGTGIAGTLIVDGVAHRAGGYAGEIGHTVVEHDGPACVCGGSGCLEAIASAAAIARIYRESGGSASGSREVLERAAAGDEAAQRTWSRAIDALATAIHQLLAISAPDTIVIGGGLSNAGPALFEPLAEALDARITVQRMPRIVPAGIGQHAGLVGAALIAEDAL